MSLSETGERTAVPRLNVLLAAYACEPGRGSEPGVGWNMCAHLSARHDVWVIADKHHEAAVLAHLRNNPNPTLHFRFVGVPYWPRILKKQQIRATLWDYVYYFSWQFFALREAKRLSHDVAFDVAHHVTYVNDWLFSFLGLLPYPFVWGPIGTHPLPPKTLARGKFDYLKIKAGALLKSAIRALSPLYWLCAYRANVIVGISQESIQSFPIRLANLARGERKPGSFVCPAIAIEELEPENEPEGDQTSEGEICFLYVGRLVAMKGPDLAVIAFAEAAKRTDNTRMMVIGDGPLRQKVTNLVSELGLVDRVKSKGWVPRDCVIRAMASCDVLVFPSWEGGGMVVLEAMALGRPVLCLDYGGPKVIADESCGLMVKPSSRKDVVAGLAKAMILLAEDGGLRRRMGEAAKRAARSQHTWEARCDSADHWYELAIENQAMRRRSP